MTTINGACAAITGAASGIGAALARRLAARGCDLALADVNAGALEDMARELRGRGTAKITTCRVDVSKRSEVETFAAESIRQHPRLNIVINNAGVALFGNLDELSLSDLEWLMGINFWGVVHGCQVFLPHLQAQPEAHIVNLSSIFGIIAPPGQTAYCAAKFAVRGFSEALRHELEQSGSRVHLSVVHPGGVDTGIARNSRVGAGMTDNARRAESLERFAAVPKATPDEAAERILAGVARNEARILIGADARRMDLLQRLKPATYWATIAKRIDKMTRQRGT